MIVSRAYSSAFCKITKIQIFTILDTWQENSGEVIKNFNLYVVESKEFNTFFNKSNNLCYGRFLKYFPKDKIIIKYVKKPSWVVPVNFKELVDELYETHISDNQHENKQLQKTIANTVIGLLGKSINKKHEIKDIYRFSNSKTLSSKIRL